MPEQQSGLPVPSFAAFYEEPEQVGPPKSIMVYGFQGTRKTSAIGDMIKVPGFNRGLIIDIDNGTEVLSNDPIVWQAIQDGRIVILKIDSLAANAQAKIDAVIDEVCSQNFGFDFVGLDTLDVAQDVVEKNAKITFATSGKGGKKDGFAIWGEVGTWTDEKVRKLHNCPFFTAVITVHAKEQTKDDGHYRILPTLSGSSKDSIGGAPSVVVYVEYQTNPEDGSRHLIGSIGESDVTITKNRYRLQPTIVDFTLPGLYALIEESKAARAAGEREAA